MRELHGDTAAYRAGFEDCRQLAEAKCDEVKEFFPTDFPGRAACAWIKNRVRFMKPPKENAVDHSKPQD